MIKIKKQKNRAFVILFAMMISSIILMIALGITNIATKEIKFSSSAKDTNDAFFAADTGAECALRNDRTDNPLVSFTEEGIYVNCLGNNTINTTFNNNPKPNWNFTVSGLSFNERWCANVKVIKDNTNPNNIITTIVSKGYNTGDPSACVQTENSVERQIELNY